VEILKFDTPNPAPRRKQNKSSSRALLAIVGVAAIAVLGSTLAANISINSGTAVEFGQGVSLTSACDGNGITANPSATFANVSGQKGSFTFGTIAFTGIDIACAGKVFTVKAYGDSSNTPVVLNTISATPYSFASFNYTTIAAGTYSGNIAPNGYTYGTGTNGTYNVYFSGTQSDPANIYKITLESSAS
jgi:hypothetical protein